MYGGGGRYGRMSGGSPSAPSSGGGRAWSSEGRGVRNSSPGWHSFARSGSSGSRNGASTASFHSAIADGQWHSFGGAHGAVGSGLTANARTGVNNSFSRNGGFAHGGYGGRGYYGGGYRGYGYGWGGCWGCGWGFGWGLGWNPFWYWPSYWYSPWWVDGYPPPSYIDPYPY